MNGPSTITCTNWAPWPAFGGHFCGQAGSYGTLGVADAGNHPGGRAPSARWMDSSGNFWLYGGEALDFPGSYVGNLGVDPTGYWWGPVDDLWVYSPASGKWTWMGGHNKTENCEAVLVPYGTEYGWIVACTGPGGFDGTLGKPGAGNTPGIRYGELSRTDKDGNF